MIRMGKSIRHKWVKIVVIHVASRDSIQNVETAKFLNFRMPENFAVIYLKFKQRGQSLRYFIKMMQME